MDKVLKVERTIRQKTTDKPKRLKVKICFLKRFGKTKKVKKPIIGKHLITIKITTKTLEIILIKNMMKKW